MICKGKHEVNIRQPVGTVTLWKATEYEHTISVDEPAYVKMWKCKIRSNDLLSVGLGIVQKKKLLSVPSNRHDVVSRLFSIDVLQAYGSADASNEEVNSSDSKKRSSRATDEEVVGHFIA